MKISHEFIPYEQALELKELGFNEECSAYYFVYQDKLRFSYAAIENDFDSGNDIIDYVTNSDFHKEYATAPNYRQIFRWFREKQGLFARVDFNSRYDDLPPYYDYIIGDMNHYVVLNVINEEFATYEEAELACLKKLIELVKNK